MSDQSSVEKKQPPVETKLCFHKLSNALLENKKARTIALSCMEWFNDHPDALATFLRTLRRQEAFSLRIVDWTTTNYSRRHRITIYHRGLPVDLHNDYRRYLSVFTKKYFDPFARRERLILSVGGPDGQDLSTTVGQLNFMRWMLEREVHLKVQDLRKDIEADMRDYDGKRKERVKPDDQFLVYTGPFRLLF